tara:strand:- start:84 stop:248 length:165 start_codon:yes stop_codon:yes gene_type:complete
VAAVVETMELFLLVLEERAAAVKVETIRQQPKLLEQQTRVLVEVVQVKRRQVLD